MWQGTRDLNHLDLLYPAEMLCSLSSLPARTPLTLTPVPQSPCSDQYVKTTVPGAEQEDSDVSSLGLAADSCIFQLSGFVFETFSESE